MVRLYALLAVLGLVGTIWLYSREFQVFTNTLDARWLVIGSLLVGLALSLAAVWRWRERFTPWDRHLPEVLLLVLCTTLVSPLFGSLLNRALGSDHLEGFEFLAETPYVAEAYGVFYTQKLRPNGWQLSVRQNGRLYQFRYKTQAYFPITQPGEPILLPVRRGLFGARVVTLW